MKQREEIKSLNKFLRKWLKENGFTCKVRYGTDFSFINDDTIQWSLLCPAEESEYYKQFLYENGLDYDCDLFILSFFHELGHLETVDECTEEELDSYLRMQEKNKNKKRTTQSLCISYYTHPVELLANLWMIDYINNNPDKIEKFWSEVQRLVMDIYKSYVEEEEK